MDRFRTDNTEGYSADDLAALNAAWISLPLPKYEDDDALSHVQDHVAERLLAEYDAGKRGSNLVAFYYAA